MDDTDADRSEASARLSFTPRPVEEERVQVGATEQLASDLQRVCPELSRYERELLGSAREARRRLSRWGHEGHEMTLERADRGPGDRALRCWFWCESCHVSQLLVLNEPGVR